MKTETENDVEKIGLILTSLVKGLVRTPEAVRVQHAVQGRIIQYAFKASPTDGGRVIGSKGKHINALKVLIQELARRAGYEPVEECPSFDEKPFTGEPSNTQRSTFTEAHAKKSKLVTDNLKKLIQALVNEKEKVTVNAAELATTIMIDVKVARADYSLVYGEPVDMDTQYPSGRILSAIQNLFDGIGKNNGFQTIKVSLSVI